MNYCTTFIIDGKCSNCGAEVEDTDKYCHECGKRMHPAERMKEEVETKARHYAIFNRWLDGGTLKEIAGEFGVSPSTVALIPRYTLGRLRFEQMPDDIQKRLLSMLGERCRGCRVYTYYEELKVIRKL